jgi:hypothetical protein
MRLQLHQHRLDVLGHRRDDRIGAMTAPEPGLDFHARRAAPGFVATGPPRVLRKSEVLVGTVDGVAVLAKRIARPSAVWAWYFAREVAIYRAFADMPPDVRVPRLVVADAEVLVIEHIGGSPLATRRRPASALPAPVLDALLAALDRLAAWSGSVPDLAPSPYVRAQLRDRLLEDPTDPAWIADGARRASRRGLVDAGIANAIADAIGTETAFAHGDMLLRNAIGNVLVDWECAGRYPRDWDKALLWTQLAPHLRPIVEASVPAPRRPAFVALAAFALVRELRFADAFGADRSQIAGELEAVAGRL